MGKLDVSEQFFEPGDDEPKATTPDPDDTEAQQSKSGTGGGGNDSQATVLVRLAGEAGAELFHNSDGDAYARIWAEDHHEVWLLRQKKFKVWLSRLFYEEAEKSPNASAMQDALNVLEGKAVFDGERHEVHTRVAEHEGAIYHDLANDLWEAVEVTADGWRVM